jgi:hypothetical protein
MMKKSVVLFFLLTLGLLSQPLPQRLAELIKNKDWNGLAALCADSSHQAVAAHFDGAAALVLGVDGDKQLSYHARYADYAEIGKLTFFQQADRPGSQSSSRVRGCPNHLAQWDDLSGASA